MLARLDGVVMLILGGLFWTGNALALIPVHMLLGIVLVLTLWSLALIAARSGVQPGLVGFAIVWGFVVPILGMTQSGLLPGPAHWVIQVIHLLVGITAVGLADTLGGASLKRVGPPQAAPHGLVSSQSG